MLKYQQDAARIAEVFRESGAEMAAKLYHEMISERGYPYWGTLALKDEAWRLIHSWSPHPPAEDSPEDGA